MQHALAVVIPTYSRLSALQRCLQHLEQQTVRDFDVVVVDDGSTDGTSTWVAEYLKKTPLHLRYLWQSNSGQARARNLAVSQIDADITVLVGDDIFPSPQFVEQHRRLHQQRPEQSVVGLGLTVWAEQGQTVTPFMRWLDRDGLQFHYGELLSGTKPDWRHFYTSNLSLKTSLLRDFPFNETFLHYGMEDIELAVRIDAQHGLDMVFLPEARAEHLHPTTFQDACRRMEKIGAATAHFDTLWPGKLSRDAPSRLFNAGETIAALPFAMPILRSMAAQSVRVARPNKLMTFVLNHYFHKGYTQATSGR